jgi:hypothetical protein
LKAFPRIIVASPGCGKTYYRRILESRGVTVFETDDVPEVREAIAKGVNIDSPAEFRKVGAIAGERLRSGEVVLTNMWDDNFITGLGVLHLPLGFYKSAADVVKILRDRAPEHTVRATSIREWIDVWKNQGPDVFRMCAHLKRGIYLSDVDPLSMWGDT